MDSKDSQKISDNDIDSTIDSNKNKANAEKAERLFSDYLNNLKIPFYFIDQSKEKYSDEFKENKMQRPDFIIYTKYSIFHIDVKHRTKYYLDKYNKTEKYFYLNQKELKKTFNFQSELNTTVWIAFIDVENPDVENTIEFCFSSISDIFEYYEYIRNNINSKYPKIVNDFENSPKSFIYIPKRLIFEQLSFEKGFYRKPDLKLIDNETESYVHRLENIIKKEQ